VPGDLSVLAIGPDDLGEGELDAHGMAPVAVLASLGQLGGSLPPTYVVGCRPADVSEGIGLTPAVARAVEPAMELVRGVLVEQLGLEVALPAGRTGGSAPAPNRKASP
jgi:hydrogenase maturation protease